MTIKIGDKARDTISGFAGIVTERHEYFNGCVRFGISPDRLGQDGKPLDTFHFDVEQLEMLEENAVPRTVTATGGPRSDPAQRPAAKLRSKERERNTVRF